MKNLTNISGFFCSSLLAIFLVSCASNVKTQITASPQYLDNYSEKTIQITETLKVSSSAGYSRVIKSGSRWEYVGSISNGNVYKSANSIFTIEGSHVHEAYLVIENRKLAGFYLPVERAFSKANNAQSLNYITTHNQRSKL